MIKHTHLYLKKFTIEPYIDFWHNLNFFMNNQHNQNTSSWHSFHLKYWRKLFFTVQALANHKLIAELLTFFKTTILRRDIVLTHPCILQQAVRQWFYYNSTMRERINILQGHFLLLENRLSHTALQHIYLGKGILLWCQEYKNDKLSLMLHFNHNYRKEGLLAITLKLGEKRIYLLTFWITPSKNGENALWIGALQGAKGDLQINRDLTKHFFGYRPQNLILFALRTIAQQLGIELIYAVSNHGFQASHHISAKRRLKTSFDDFWKETQGKICDDSRFFNLPVIEARKSLAEVSSHKRNLYRKRFAMLDVISAEIKKAFEPYIL
jgi:uncharacterized protein VirK/YbjX